MIFRHPRPHLFRHVLLLAIALPGVAASQRPDSVARRPAPAPLPARTDTLVRRPPPAPPKVAVPQGNDSLTPPLSPRKAFLYSFLLPGYSQSILGRHKAGATFILVEAIALGMIRESAADTHEARRLQGDSIVVSYVDASGNAAVTRAPPLFDDKLVRSRRAHVEDWAALLVANHLFAGADAFVAANLWDIPARLGLHVLPGGAGVSGSFRW